MCVCLLKIKYIKYIYDNVINIRADPLHIKGMFVSISLSFDQIISLACCKLLALFDSG